MSSSSSSLASEAAKGLTKQQLNTFAHDLKSHLSSRLNQPLLATIGGVRTDFDSSVVQHVCAKFITHRRLLEKGVPKPFAVEIQLKQPDPVVIKPDRTRIETAYLLFFSTKKRESETHYPVMFWRAAPLDGLQKQDGDVEAPQLAVTGRLLTSQTLSFLAAYFDCRISSLAPLHGIRGKNLQDIAEGVVKHARQRTDHLAMELTFALPSKVNPFGDSSETIIGPAPELNTISLSVPAKVTEEIMDGRSHDTPTMPAIHHYLSSHTSIQLSRLTLTRVGIANVYLGAPTSTASPSGKASSGEVRLKISRDADGTCQDDLIEAVLLQFIQVAEKEQW